jgi:hypothetical protein
MDVSPGAPILGVAFANHGVGSLVVTNDPQGGDHAQEAQARGVPG